MKVIFCQCHNDISGFETTSIWFHNRTSFDMLISAIPEFCKKHFGCTFNIDENSFPDLEVMRPNLKLAFSTLETDVIEIHDPHFNYHIWIYSLDVCGKEKDRVKI